MNQTTFEDYLTAVRNRRPNMGERWGQAYFNTLALIRPDDAAMVHGTDLDPFYNDNIIDDFLALVAW